MAGDLLGNYRIESPSLQRQFLMDSFAAIRPMHSMTAFLEMDVTRPSERIATLRERGVRLSLFAHVVRSIGIALAEHPDLNVVRHGKRIAYFEDVDVSIPVEMPSDDGRFPFQMLVRRAQDKSATQIYAEIEQAKTHYHETGTVGAEDQWARRIASIVRYFPRFMRLWLVRRLVADARIVKRRAGTTLVTSVGKFATIPGFVTTFAAGPRATSFAIGSVVEKPVVRDGEVVIRSILALTCIVDHDVVDGSPAARFAVRLQELIEGVEGLDEAAADVARAALG